MPDYAQQNPGLFHVGHRYPSPNLIRQVPEAVKQLITLKFKTAVVTNRVVYVGNVSKTNLKGETTVEGDAMYKSSVNKFDTFADFRKIEVSVNDGDEIVKLEEYSDRILQFKKHKMHLINVSQEIEFLEDTLLYKGVSHPAATCKTDFGIAWVNKFGCYLYDGKQVQNLLEKKGRKLIKDSDWETFTSYEPMIGYLPKKRQLIVAHDITDNGDGRIFLYDIVTQSWVEGSPGSITNQPKTNFITDWNGDLVYGHTNGTMLKWDDASDATSGIDIKTKDIDFGHPAVRKKIYKVYVTHRGATSEIQTSYSIDGNNGTFTEFPSSGTELPASSPTTDWVTTELKLSISNCYSLQLRFFSDGTTPSTFEINDISIVYRIKQVK